MVRILAPYIAEPPSDTDEGLRRTTEAIRGVCTHGGSPAPACQPVLLSATWPVPSPEAARPRPAFAPAGAVWGCATHARSWGAAPAPRRWLRPLNPQNEVGWCVKAFQQDAPIADTQLGLLSGATF